MTTTSRDQRSGRRAGQRFAARFGVAALVTLVASAVVFALVLQGYALHEVGASWERTTDPADHAAVSLPGGGPLIYRASERGLVSRRPPAKTVALTFDDGPDPRWTPQILAVLRREKVPATFFVVGARAAESPGLVRAELAAGNEIGSHTFSHADLDRIPGWQARIELTLTQLTLAGGAGINTALVRPPYSSGPQALTRRQLPVLQGMADKRYAVVLTTQDSEDWRRPGVGRIVANAVPARGAGAVVLFHDSGGDRSQTIASLPQVIEQLRARGYRFTTVSGLLGLPPMAAVHQVSALEHLRGLAFLTALRGAELLANGITWLLLLLGLLSVARTVWLLGLAGRHVRVAARRLDGPRIRPALSVVVPAYNEAVGIAASVRSLVASGYPDLEVIVVDDGSTDGTAEVVDALGLAGVRVVRQANQGKPAALGAGIALARHDILVLVDGDTVFETGTLDALVQPFRDPRVGAVSGNTKVGNRRGLLGRWQHLEYVVGFNLDRRMYDLLGCLPTVPGAVGAFRREALAAVGGVSADTLAEDTDLTMAINRAGWRIVYEERALAWTEAPADLGGLWRQRYRWCYGTLQAVWKHRGAVLGRGSDRRLGWVGFPYLLAFQVALPLLAPLIDLFALYGLVFLSPTRVVLSWVGFLLLQLVSAAYALRLDRERYSTLWALPLQQFVYRQMMYAVVVRSVVSALSGVRLRWHKLERTGDVAVPVSLETAQG